jgi:HEAT repeat protein
MMRRCLSLAVIFLFLVAVSTRGQQPLVIPAGTDGVCREPADPVSARLFALLLHQTGTEADPDKLNELVKQLGSADYERRRSASSALGTIGRPALARLQRALKDPDLEIRRRAQDCIDVIETYRDKDAAYNAVTQLLRTRPPGTAEVLLAYLPEADAETADEIWQGMQAVAVHEGKVDPAIRAALDDKRPERRALAALLVGRHGAEADRTAVREHLTDDDAEVRLRAAQGLLAAGDKAAVPALVALLPDAPLELAWQAEELLHYLAGAAAPAAGVGAGDAAARKKCHADWVAWWQAEEPRFDVTRPELARRRPGLLLVCGQQSLWLCGCDGKPRWRIDGLEYPTHVQALPGPRFLVVEPNTSRLTERDVTGKIVWQPATKGDDYFTSAQRLANGNTFAATEDQFVVYRPDGQVLSRIDVADTAANNGLDLGMGDAVRLRSGTVVARSNTGVIEVDAVSGQFLQGANVPNFRGVQMCRMAVSPDGRCLLADMRRGRVIEVDLTGKILWEQNVPNATSVEWLRNGNVVIGVQRESRLFEVTRDGKHVWETNAAASPNRVRDAYSRVRLGFDPRPAGFDLNSVANRIEDLKDRDVLLRRRAANALAVHGAAAKSAIPALIDALADDNTVCNHARTALVRIGTDALPALLKTLRHTNARSRDQAWMTLAQMGAAAKPVLPDVVAALRDPKEPSNARQSATRVLAAMGLEGAGGVPALLEALKSNDDALRFAAAQALPSLSRDDEVVAGLIAALKDKQYPQGAVGAAQALRTLGTIAVKALPDLVSVLDDRTYAEDVRIAAAWGCANMGKAARDALKPYAKILKDPGQPAKLRIAVAQTLAALGTEATPALAAFAEILRDVSLPDELSIQATNSLPALGQQGMQVLVLLVHEGNDKAKLMAIQNLQNQGENAKIAIPALMEAAVQDQDPEVRKQANAAAQCIQSGGGRGRGKFAGGMGD